jgi:Zn-finger nucleic acid-binding protein
MQEVPLEGMKVHYDAASGGYWLEKGELETLAQHHAAPLALVQITAGQVQQGAGTRLCPQDSTPLIEYEFGEHSSLRLDICPTCGGIWLDGGELQRLLWYLDANAHLGAEIPNRAAVTGEHIHLSERVLLILYKLTERPPLL